MLTLACAGVEPYAERPLKRHAPLTCWSCGFECCFLRFEFNGSMCLWMVGTSWRQPKMLKPQIQKFGWKNFWPPVFFKSRGDELWVNRTFSHHLCITPLPVIIVLDIRYPQLGRCLGGEIHLIFWALRIVVFFNLPRLRSQNLALSRFCLVGQHERKDVIHATCPVCFGAMLFGKFWPPQNVTWGIQVIKAGLTHGIGLAI